MTDLPEHLTFHNLCRAGDLEGVPMMPEEVEVAEALKGYRPSPRLKDWVPTRLLYSKYQQYRMKHPGSQAYPLDVRRFGLILGLVFPSSEKCARRLNGTLYRGRAFLRGPDKTEADRRVGQAHEITRICPICGMEFTRKIWRLNETAVKYCSRVCGGKARKLP